MGLLVVLQGGEGGPPSSCLSFPAPAWGAPWLATAASSWGCGDRTGVRTAPPRAGHRGVRATGIVTVPPQRSLEMSPGSFGGTENFMGAGSRRQHPARTQPLPASWGRWAGSVPSPKGSRAGSGTGPHIVTACRQGKAPGGRDGDSAVVGMGRVGRGCWIWTGWAPWACPQDGQLTHSLSWGSPWGCSSSPLGTSWGSDPAGMGALSSTGCPRRRAGGHWRPSQCRGQPPALSSGPRAP